MMPEQIQKAAWNVKENIKDTVDKSLSEAMQQKLINLDESQMSTVINIVKNSIDQGYHSSNRMFTKVVEESISIESSKIAKHLYKK